MDFFGLNKFVIEFLKNKLSSNLYYHGVHHTEDVVQSLDEICFHEKVNPEEYFILKTAVLFHDMGYIDQYNIMKFLELNMLRKFYLNTTFLNHK